MSVSILVVDDEADVAELFRQQFRREVRQSQYVMHFAASAEEALGWGVSLRFPEGLLATSEGMALLTPTDWKRRHHFRQRYLCHLPPIQYRLNDLWRE